MSWWFLDQVQNWVFLGQKLGHQAKSKENLVSTLEVTFWSNHHASYSKCLFWWFLGQVRNWVIFHGPMTLFSFFPFKSITQYVTIGLKVVVLGICIHLSMASCMQSSIFIPVLFEEKAGLLWFVCFCWGFTAQSTQWGHVKRNQFTGQAWSSKRLTSTVHILSPETDNCPSWIRGYCDIPCPSIRTSVCNVTPLLLDHLS